jgi:Ca-activated chloride channel family protein
MAEALGWPGDPIAWADIAAFAANDQGWEAYDHPEWGAFQFGHTHPDYSNSGITSILAMAYAATGKTSGLTVDDVRESDVAEFISAVESGVIHYGRSTGFFARQMFNRGPSYLSAAVMYENLVIESYNEALYPDIPLPVVAIYPSEGTFWSDHPFTILNAPWVDEELRAAAEMYRDYLLATPQQERALEFGFRPASLDVEIGAPIVPEHGVDPNEPQTLLSVPEAEVIEEVRDIWGANKKRVEVQVVLDISGSMDQEQRLQRAKEALIRFVEQLADEDRLGIVVFSDEASVLTPLEAIGPRRQEVIEQINGLSPYGGTRLIDTVSEVYQQLEQEPAGERIRAMVVLSDGDDNMSQGTEQTLMEVLGGDESGQSIKVFTIAYGTGTDVNLSLLTTIAEASGAKLYESTPGEITEVYLDIATFF